MRAFGIILGAIGTVFVFFVNWILGFATIVVAIILLLIGKKPEGLKKCPKCAEEIKVEAVVCRFCGYEFPENKLTGDDLTRYKELRAKKDELERKISFEVDQIKRLELKKELRNIEAEIERKFSQEGGKS